jgi:chromosome segregation ATPase
LEKTQQQRAELVQIAQQVTGELEQVEYEREQYSQQVQVVTRESEAVDGQIERASVKEHEIIVVTALIDEKARLTDEKAQLRKNCKEEKIKLESELERMKRRREEMQKEEAAEVLRQIDAEYDHEHEKLSQQRKQIADVNRSVTVVQRKIENCPSKIEITQFHKRLVELFDNLNLKSEENRRYVNLFNTVMETRKLFRQQTDYMREINDSYKACK